jgi:hypothetical protein
VTASYTDIEYYTGFQQIDAISNISTYSFILIIRRGGRILCVDVVKSVNHKIGKNI